MDTSKAPLFSVQPEWPPGGTLDALVDPSATILRSLAQVLPQLKRLDRYAQRVMTRGRQAIWKFCKTKPKPEIVLPKTTTSETTQGCSTLFTLSTLKEAN